MTARDSHRGATEAHGDRDQHQHFRAGPPMPVLGLWVSFDVKAYAGRSSPTFWALGRIRETVDTAARNSLNFAAFAGDGNQVAYARVATDCATFAWVCDVYVDRDHRGRGLGTRLSEAVVAALLPMNLKRVLLSTLDAHEVYARVGFVPMPNPEKLMILGHQHQPLVWLIPPLGRRPIPLRRSPSGSSGSSSCGSSS